MSVLVLASTATATRSGTTCTVSSPSGLAAGDMMFARTVNRSNNGEGIKTISPPAGWTVVTANGASQQFWKKATAGDVSGGSFVFSNFPNLASDDHGFAAIDRITGGNQLVLIDDSNASSVSGTTAMTTSGATPTFIDLLIIVAAHIQSTNGTTVSASSYAVANSNPSWTQASTQSASTADANNLGQSAAWGNASVAGATGNATATANASAGTHYISIFAIKASDSTITVTPTVVSMGSTALSPATTQQVFVTVVSLASTVLAPVVSLLPAKWVNATKTAVASMTNTAKHAVASMTNTAKAVSTWINSSKS